MLTKQEFRSIYLQKRKELAVETIENRSIEIANQLLHLPIWNFSFFHVYLPITSKQEVDTTFIINILMGKDKEIIVPKMMENGKLSNYLLTDNTKLRPNKYGIPEPENGILIAENQIEVVFVPLLVFDTLGNRIGYGKGFYDQFLNQCNQNVIKIGLSFFEAEEKLDCIENHDVTLNFVVTPKQIYSF